MFLPEEVLSHIFSYLHASDRKDVRRASSAFYEACNTMEIIRMEKLRFPGVMIRAPNLVFGTLMSSRLKYLNLEFEKFQFDSSSASFWKNCGSRITSLAFRHCFFESYKIIQDILMNCINLESLEIDSVDDRTDWKSSPSSDAIFLGFHRCTIVRKKVIALKLRNCKFLNDFVYNNIVRVFPNIRELLLESINVNCCKRIDRRFYAENERNYNSDLIFSFSCVFNHLKRNARKVKRLSIHSIGHGGLKSNWLNEIATHLRLEYLSLEEHSELEIDSLLNLFSKQTDLKKINLRSIRPEISCKLLHELIRNCPELKHLKLEFFREPTFQDERLLRQLLLCKKPRELQLSCRPIAVNIFKNARNDYMRAHTLCVPINVNVYRALTSLTITKCESGHSLHELEDADLQIVFHNLDYLKALKIFIGGRISDYAFTGRIADKPDYVDCSLNASIRNLKQLESLEITEYQLSRITYRTVNELDFPRLEFLHLDFSTRLLSDKRYCQRISVNTPLLKHLSVLSRMIHPSILFILRLMKKLVVLDLRKSNFCIPVPKWKFLHLLQSNDTVRLLDTDSQIFYRDAFTQEWIIKEKVKNP